MKSLLSNKGWYAFGTSEAATKEVSLAAAAARHRILSSYNLTRKQQLEVEQSELEVERILKIMRSED